MRNQAALLLLGMGTILQLPMSEAAQGPSSTRQVANCDPVGDLRFVCGLQRPEDLMHVPGTQSLISSGMAGNGAGGLFLIDIPGKSARKLNFGDQITVRPDRETYPDCTMPAEATQFATHGLSLRMRSPTRGTLYAVVHGSRESIDAFDVDASSGTPTLTWRGCVPMPPELAANSVTSLPDGTLYATVLARSGKTLLQMFGGERTGDVYTWKRGDRQFQLVPGISLQGNNGIEASPDGSTLYVVATGAQELFAFSRSAPGSPLRSAHFDTFIPDNIRWVPDGRLIVTGMNIKDPACPRPGTNGQLNLTECKRAPSVALVDPDTMKVQMLYDGKTNPMFTGAAGALVIGSTLWLSSLAGDRVAYLELERNPFPQSAAQ